MSRLCRRGNVWAKREGRRGRGNRLEGWKKKMAPRVVHLRLAKYGCSPKGKFDGFSGVATPSGSRKTSIPPLSTPPSIPVLPPPAPTLQGSLPREPFQTLFMDFLYRSLEHPRKSDLSTLRARTSSCTLGSNPRLGNLISP